MCDACKGSREELLARAEKEVTMIKLFAFISNALLAGCIFLLLWCAMTSIIFDASLLATRGVMIWSLSFMVWSLLFHGYYQRRILNEARQALSAMTSLFIRLGLPKVIGGVLGETLDAIGERGNEPTNNETLN